MFPSDADYETSVLLETESTPLADEPPFHLLLLGDWSGRESRSIASPPKYHPIEIDRDNFDDVIKKLNVGLSLDFQGDGNNFLSINFTELEDFHPDRVFQQLPVFDNLRDVRRRLVKADSFNDAADEVRSWFLEDDLTHKKANTQPSESATTNSSSPDDLLDQILVKTDEEISTAQSQNVGATELSRFIKDIVQPHLIHTDTTEQSKLLMVVDEVISDLMRKILHHPQFQALEAAWRGAFLLVRQIETDTDLKIFLMDVSKNELKDDLKSTEDLTDSQLYKAFFRKNTNLLDDKKWSVVCGVYTFSLNVEDVAALIRVSKIAASSNSPFISHSNPEIFGFNSFGEADDSDNWNISENSTGNKLWTTLRSIPEAAYLGLALPRLLARLPYGDNTNPTETFSFEEFRETINHEEYVWINPAFACALLLTQTFRRFGWNISDNLLQDINSLPLHLLKNGDEAKPCAEITMNEKNYQQILDHGLIPLISFKNADRVRLGRLQSVSSSASILKGIWS